MVEALGEGIFRYVLFCYSAVLILPFTTQMKLIINNEFLFLLNNSIVKGVRGREKLWLSVLHDGVYS